MTPLAHAANTDLIKIQPKHRLSQLVFPPTLLEQVHHVLDDYRYQEALAENGLIPAKRILLHGPSGCGKTSLAHALAGELDMPVYQLNLSEAIGSHVGETGKNVAKAIEFASLNKVLLLLDEFDAVASSRTKDSAAAGKEHNKTVNTILVDLENREPRGMVVACTNHMDLLDGAVMRRFDASIEVPMPSKELLEKVARDIFGGRFGLHPNDIWITEEDSPALVSVKAKALLRRKVIEKAKLEEAKTGEMFQTSNPAREIREKLSGERW